MMTQQLEVSIIAAPLAAIDRRALSQAWYSALGLAQAKRSIPPTIGQPARIQVSSPIERASSDRRSPLQTRNVEPRPSSRAPMKTPGVSTPQPAVRGADRRVVPLSQRIERRFALPAQTRRATFSMGRGAARVFVILQTNGNVATLVALCRPEMRTVVARALAGARFALTTQGLVIDLQTPPARCS